ncbi:MAG: flavohemoglobin expression-modulating QEGLA motif protein [Actinomycetota bacterium]
MSGDRLTPDQLERLRGLSDALVAAQKPILILNSVKWTDDVRAAFFADGAGSQPRIDDEYYARERPLKFETEAKRQELNALRHDAHDAFGDSPVGELLKGRIDGYLGVIDLLTARGTHDFGPVSDGLYGGVGDPLHVQGPTLAELGDLLDVSLANISNSRWEPPEQQTYTAEEGVAILQERLEPVCGMGEITVKLDDGIVSDAAAGSDYIKLREDATFSDRSLRVLEVHEGWVHVATSINGRNQPWCTFLAKGTPSTTITQEGLAVFTEITTLSSTPTRLRKISRRMEAIGMAADGATFLDVYRWMLDEGLDEDDAWVSTVRVFRGSTPTGPPFTKDLVYSRGFLEVYNVIRLAVRHGRLELLPLLFVGKISVREIELLVQLHADDVVIDPPILPPSMSDVTALASWMAFSNLLNRVDAEAMEVELGLSGTPTAADLG